MMTERFFSIIVCGIIGEAYLAMKRTAVTIQRYFTLWLRINFFIRVIFVYNICLTFNSYFLSSNRYITSE